VRRGGLARKTLHTFATLLFGQGASIAAGIATAHAYGPAGKGIIAFAGILLTFAVTTADGLKSAIAFQVGSRRRDARAVWRAALRLMAVLGPLGTAIFLGLYLHAPDRVAYLYVAIAFPFSMYVQAVGIVYALRDRVERINVKNALTIGGGYSLAIFALVLLFHVPVWVVMSVWIAGYALAAIWSSFGLRDLLVPETNGKVLLANAPSLMREQLVFAAKSALSANVTFLALRIDVFIVSASLSPEALGVYTLAISTGEVMWQLSRSLIWSSSGRVAMLPLDESADLVARVVRSLVAVQLVVGVALFVAGPWAIAHVYGSRFAESGALLRVLLPGLVLYGADGMLSYFIGVRAGRPALLLALETVTLVACGGLTLLAIPRVGLAGAALADTVAYVLSFAIKVGFFVRIAAMSPLRVLVARPSDVPAFVALRLRRLFGTRATADR
jgi:O-antigen/teichoic acid export membrane protein